MTEDVQTALGGAGLLGIFLKLAYDYVKAKGPQNAGHEATTSLIDKLQKEAEKWQSLYDETHKLLDAQRETNTLLRSQNAMMRLLLIQKGVTETELIAIGAIHPAEHHEQ